LDVSSYSIPGSSAVEMLEFASENGFAGFEFWGDDIATDRNDKKRFRLAQDQGIHISVHGPIVNISALNPDQRKAAVLEVKNSIDIAYEYGAKTLVLHPGTLDKDASNLYSMNDKLMKDLNYYTKESIEALLNHAQAKGVMIALENVGYLENDFITSYVQLNEIINYFNSNILTINLDVAHANITEGVENAIELFGRRIKHMHVSNNFGEINEHHKPLGEGNINFRRVRKLIMDNEIIPILEIRPCKDAREVLLRSKDYLMEEMF